MPRILSPKHYHANAVHRFWLYLAAATAFLLAALWAQPVG